MVLVIAEDPASSWRARREGLSLHYIYEWEDITSIMY